MSPEDNRSDLISHHGVGVLLSNWWSPFKNREKWCFNSGKIHDWHNSWRGVSILVIMAESWRTRSVATFWIIQAFFLSFNNVILHDMVLKKSTHFSLIWADTDSRHRTEGNQWTDGKIRIRRSLFSLLLESHRNMEYGFYMSSDERAYEYKIIINWYIYILFLILLFLLFIYIEYCVKFMYC